MYCSSCGKKISNQGTFCPHSGTRISFGLTLVHQDERDDQKGTDRPVAQSHSQRKGKKVAPMKLILWSTVYYFLLLALAGEVVLALAVVGITTPEPLTSEPSLLGLVRQVGQFTTIVTFPGAAAGEPEVAFLVVGLAARFGYIQLMAPFDLLATTPALILLAIVSIVALVPRLVPGLGHIMDVIGRLINVTAGLMMAMIAVDVIKDMHPAVALVAVLIGGMVSVVSVAGGTALERLLEGATGGIGRPVIKIAKIITTFMFMVLAIMAPFIAVISMVYFGVISYQSYRIIKEQWRKIKTGEAFGRKERLHSPGERVVAAIAHLSNLVPLFGAIPFMIWVVNWLWERFRDRQSSIYVATQSLQAAIFQFVFMLPASLWSVMPLVQSVTVCLYVVPIVMAFWGAYACFLGRECRYPVVGGIIEELYFGHLLFKPDPGASRETSRL